MRSGFGRRWEASAQPMKPMAVVAVENKAAKRAAASLPK
jgi:hypothetical protein